MNYEKYYKDKDYWDRVWTSNIIVPEASSLIVQITVVITVRTNRHTHKHNMSWLDSLNSKRKTHIALHNLMKILHTQISAAAMIKELKFCTRIAGHNGCPQAGPHCSHSGLTERAMYVQLLDIHKQRRMRILQVMNLEYGSWNLSWNHWLTTFSWLGVWYSSGP